MSRYAILIDGAFAIRKLKRRRDAFPTAADIEAVASAIGADECLNGLSRLRVYFYHARPAIQILTNPLSKQAVALSETRVHADHARLLNELEIVGDFALRLRDTSTVGVTGHSDLIPAFKFARREGVRVFLCHLDHSVKRELRAHADRIIRVDMAALKPGRNPLVRAA